MAGIKALVLLAFFGSVGMTLVVLGCALPNFGPNWWPFFVLIFYLLAPLPTLIARRFQDDIGSSNACKELALFLTAGIVISAYGLPIVLARATAVQFTACLLILFGNTVVFLTILGFFIAFDNDDDGYSMW